MMRQGGVEMRVGSVRRRLFHAVDNDSLDRPFLRLEFQSELLLERGENRRTGEVGRAGRLGDFVPAESARQLSGIAPVLGERARVYWETTNKITFHPK
jgi:hypothetical protein